MYYPPHFVFFIFALCTANARVLYNIPYLKQRIYMAHSGNIMGHRSMLLLQPPLLYLILGFYNKYLSMWVVYVLVCFVDYCRAFNIHKMVDFLCLIIPAAFLSTPNVYGPDTHAKYCSFWCLLYLHYLQGDGTQFGGLKYVSHQNEPFLVLPDAIDYPMNMCRR